MKHGKMGCVNTSSESLQQRYLVPPFPEVDESNPVVDLLLSHRSVRRFIDESVTERHVATMVAAAQSASSSSNLQLWSVVEVRDQATKQRIAEVAGTDGAHLASAPVVLFFIADVARACRVFEDEHAKAADSRAVDQEVIDGADMANALNLETTMVAFGDALIAAQNAAVAAEAMGLGICYLGSIRNDVPAIAEILGLPQHSFAAVGMTVGHPNPQRPTRIKTRLPIAAVWHREQYDLAKQSDEVEKYEAAAAQFYTGQGMAPSWIGRNFARLFATGAIGKRSRMAQWLRNRGLGLD